MIFYPMKNNRSGANNSTFKVSVITAQFNLSAQKYKIVNDIYKYGTTNTKRYID